MCTVLAKHPQITCAITTHPGLRLLIPEPGEPYILRASVLDPPELYRTYSSVWKKDRPGTGHAQSMLDSPQGWSADTSNRQANTQAGEWMLVNAGSAVTVSGVRIRGRTGGPPFDNQHVTAFTVKYGTDGTSWSDAVLGVQRSADESTLNDVDGGATFTGTSGNFDALFATPVKAQYIRITVQTWVNHP